MDTQNLSDKVESARNAFLSGKTRDVKFRKQQLKALYKMYEENESVFISALAQDLRKPKMEVFLTELNMVKDDIIFQLNNIDENVKPIKTSVNLATMFDCPTIYKDPYGVVLIIGAWNYPLQLGLLPVAGAIAAGNTVIVKPSEVSDATAQAINSLIPKYLDQDCYQVICGGVAETTELLKHKFDFIFFTGSTSIGKVIHQAANKHLTPVTLELGGKSPVYLDDSVDIDAATRRILWGKCLNLGQTCVAPDYLLCTKEVQAKFVEKAKSIMKEWYGDNPENSPDLCRIVSDRHIDRLEKLIQEGKIEMGGSINKKDRYIAPTIISDVTSDSKIMQEEIFGPILPIINIESAYEAINFINKREKPLTFYIFSNIDSITQLLMSRTTSGGACVNDTMLHLGVMSLPFGGVGPSGMGSYHGNASFDCFTHEKSCLIRNYNKIADVIASNRYPPYNESKLKVLTLMLKERWTPSMKYVPHILCFALGVAATYAINAITKSLGEDD